MNYWQVGCGAGGRDYSDVFLQYGIMLVGPGNQGPLDKNLEAYKELKHGKRVLTFAQEAQCGDVVILKRPYHKQWEIVAVGRIMGEYEWLKQFEDVEDWDLQHCRRVDWIRPRSKSYVKGLAQGTFRRVRKRENRDVALRLLNERETEEPTRIPPPANSISEEDLVESLIGNGLRPADAESVIRAIWHVRRLANWYASSGGDLSEHEIRTFLIVPVLMALGWSEQRIKIEWKRTDISLFHSVFKRGNDPYAILESKRMGRGLEHAESQLIRYARDFRTCNRLITSTGARYQLYVKDPGESWDARGMKENHLSAYMNLFKLKDRHPYLAGVGGAPDLLKSLMPS